jgi:hypothetical protein
MSGSEQRDASRLARDLADTAGAVPALITLLEHGGSASRETLASEIHHRDVDDAIRWLTAVNLVRRSHGCGTFDLDQTGVSYELTAIGASLTRSMIDLANTLAEPASTAKAAMSEG